MAFQALVKDGLAQRAAENAAFEQLTPEARKTLESAVADYEAAALPFAPHEVEMSSRRRELEPAVERYGLGAP